MILNTFTPETHTGIHISKITLHVIKKNLSNYSYSQQNHSKDNPFVKQAYQTMVTLSQKAFICYF